MGKKLAIDVGGTFTDVVLADDDNAALYFAKTPSSPDDPSTGVLNGIDKIFAQTQTSADEIEAFVHGTTFVTNAFLESKGSPVALLTTYGFRDVLEIGRQKRPSLYDLDQDRPAHFVPRRYRFGIAERMDAHGDVVEPLNEDEVVRAVERAREAGIRSIAVVYLHAYANAAHERQTAEIIRRVYPDCHITLSHEIAPEFREYERCITTVVNAYLKPNTIRYLSNLAQKLERIGLKSPYMVKSSGGAMSLNSAGHRAVELLLSGPAGGVTGSTFLARELGFDNIITFDMGGTSTDVAMILDQSPNATMEGQIAGYPLKVSMIDMETVGAGGGSIGWMDQGQLLKVGPESAGAIPGPACYGNGGDQPTITDANLVLGRLDPGAFYSGELELDVAAARTAFASIMAQTDLSLEQAALGVIRIGNHHMAEAVRRVTIRKGLNPRDFVLFAFGGAASLHATQIARELGIPKVLVPYMASEMSAFGFLTTDIRHDVSLTRLTPLTDDAAAAITEALDEVTALGATRLDDEAVAEADRRYAYQLDLRFKGQAFEVPVNFEDDDRAAMNGERIRSLFRQEYENRYGYGDFSAPVEIVNFRATAIGLASKVDVHALERNSSHSGASAPVRHREVYDESVGRFVATPIHVLADMGPGDRIEGHALVEGQNTTILVHAGDTAELDGLGNLHIDIARGDA
ncbi:hydantoinase/oxoprolinase family protein [Salinisphaera sp. T31B1]|uniref:hydantoinase/oxoprolinase family protein n=1 Tax=Salinisphaera sp. T31B1 TaxID=727963 RepID=UPI003340105C